MATLTTKLITKSDFSDWFELSDYLEDDKINPSILKAQTADLRAIIDNTTVSGGDTLYERLQEYLEAAKTPTDADLDALLVYITPYLVNKALTRYLPLSNIYPTNMGFRVLKEDNSEAVENVDLSAMADNANADANFFEKDLREYLCLNATTYLWSECAASKFSSAVSIGKIGYKKTKRS